MFSMADHAVCRRGAGDDLGPCFNARRLSLLERLGVQPTPLRRMSAGMVLGGVSFVISGLNSVAPGQGETLSIAWQLAPYIVLESRRSHGLGDGTGVCIAQSPPAMKSIVMSFWLMTISLGHFLIALSRI